MAKGSSKAPRRIALTLQPSFFSTNDIVGGVIRFGQRSGQFEFRDVNFDDSSEIPKKLRKVRSDGAVITLSEWAYLQVQADLPPGLPLVNIGADPLGAGVPGVCADDAVITQLAMEHLVEAGYEHLAFVGINNSPGSRRRSDLLLNAAPQAAVLELPWLGDETADEPESTPALARWLAQLERPVGIIAWHGHLARCICLSCEQQGLDVPRDVGVVSLLDELWCVLSAPTISAVRNAGDQLGYEAMKLLAGILDGRKPPEGLVQVTPLDVIARDSTVAAERSEPHVQRALEYIHENAFLGITVHDVLKATKAGSRSKFYDDFTAQVGRSPADHIRALKISRAKELLAGGTLSVARIAGMCGFESPKQFGLTFRQTVGMSPREFRNRKQR